MGEKEHYIHPIYGPCTREKNPEKAKSPYIWIRRNIVQRDLNPRTGEECNERTYTPFKKRTKS